MQSTEIPSKIEPTEENKTSSVISSLEEYQKLYNKSIESPQEFWSQIAEHFYWKSQPTNQFYSYNFDPSKGRVFTEWMAGATTNVCYNVLDRNVINGFGDSIAFYWESNDSKIKRQITYSQLLSEVSKFANVLRDLNVEKGDRVAIYMPVTIEFVVAMLACARIGAVHMAVYAGLSSEALADRMLTANCSLLLTVDGAYRGDKYLNFNEICAGAIVICNKENNNNLIIKCMVKKHCTQPYGIENTLNSDELSWDELMTNVSDTNEPVWINAEDQLFITCSSGSTGKPKLVVHPAAGFLLWAYMECKYVHNCRAGVVLFSTSDLAWMASHNIGFYGPLANTSTVVLIEGSPVYPTEERMWQIVERYKVQTLFTVPTIIRILMRYGGSNVTKYNTDSLRFLSSGGEPINPEAWYWFWKEFGQQKCLFSHMYGQTEGGAAMIASCAGVPMKPGSCGLPLFGISPAIVDSEGNELEGEASGHLVFKHPWPGIAQTYLDDHDRFTETYFRKLPGCFWSGDVGRRDKDGYYWISNRSDELLKCSGRLVSPLEIENTILGHAAVGEAVAVSAPDPIKGNSIHVFLVLNENISFDSNLETSIKNLVRTKMGSFAVPDQFHIVSALPKNHSNKVMRRILGNVCNNNKDFGDTSTVKDDSVLQELNTIQH